MSSSDQQRLNKLKLLQIGRDTNFHISLDNQDFSRLVADNIFIKNASLKNCNFDGSVLYRSTFINVDLEGSTFISSSITDVSFVNCNLEKVDFNTSGFMECMIKDSNIYNSKIYKYYIPYYCVQDDKFILKYLFASLGGKICVSKISGYAENNFGSRFVDASITDVFKIEDEPLRQTLIKNLNLVGQMQVREQPGPIFIEDSAFVEFILPFVRKNNRRAKSYYKKVMKK